MHPHPAHSLHWVDYVTLALLFAAWLIMEEMQPFRRTIYPHGDAETWRYSNPLRPNTVPAVAVPALAVCGPLLLFVVYFNLYRCPREEAHNLALGLLTNVFCAATVTNFIKLSVRLGARGSRGAQGVCVASCAADLTSVVGSEPWGGARPTSSSWARALCPLEPIESPGRSSSQEGRGRVWWSIGADKPAGFHALGIDVHTPKHKKTQVGRPRPDFVARCWGVGAPEWDAHGMPLCSGAAPGVTEGLKSFPSGHTAWSASGLGFLAFFVWGKSKAFDGSGHPTRVVLGLLPLLLALWVGLSRLQDYWHHWEDVAAGYALGLGMAYCFYRALYPPLTSSRSELPSSLYHTPRSSSSSSHHLAGARDSGLSGRDSGGGDHLPSNSKALRELRVDDMHHHSRERQRGSNAAVASGNDAAMRRSGAEQAVEAVPLMMSTNV